MEAGELLKGEDVGDVAYLGGGWGACASGTGGASGAGRACASGAGGASACGGGGGEAGFEGGGFGCLPEGWIIDGGAALARDGVGDLAGLIHNYLNHNHSALVYLVLWLWQGAHNGASLQSYGRLARNWSAVCIAL